MMMIWIIVNKCILPLWLKEMMVKAFKIVTRYAVNFKTCFYCCILALYQNRSTFRKANKLLSLCICVCFFLSYCSISKIENISKGSLDSIPSPSTSVKLQILCGKVCLRCKGKNIAGHCQQTCENKKFVDITQQCFAILPQVNFSANNLNFLLTVKLMGLNPGYLLKSFLLYEHDVCEFEVDVYP